MYLFADDIIPRWLTSAVVLDYDTIAGVDKFENFFVCRLPYGCDEESEEDHRWQVSATASQPVCAPIVNDMMT